MDKCRYCENSATINDMCVACYHHEWYLNNRKSNKKRGRHFEGRRNEFHIGNQMIAERAAHRACFIDVEEGGEQGHII